METQNSNSAEEPQRRRSKGKSNTSPRPRPRDIPEPPVPALPPLSSLPRTGLNAEGKSAVLKAKLTADIPSNRPSCRAAQEASLRRDRGDGGSTGS
jgi:hypothetical protein